MKANLIIKGNLICEGYAAGGGLHSNVTDLSKYDTEDAIVIEGDVHITNFNSKSMIVLVTGYAAGKGVYDGTC